MARGLFWPFLVVVLLVTLVVAMGHAFLAAESSTTGRVPVTDRDPRAVAGVHHTENWPTTRPRHFQQAPMLDAAVSAGKLPPVDQRLPATPLIIIPPESRGPYGGTLARCCPSLGEGLRVEVEWYMNYTGLVRWDPSGTRVIPDLAESVEVSPDARTFTFHLRKSLRWSDGEPFTSQDIRFWWDDIASNSDVTQSTPKFIVPRKPNAASDPNAPKDTARLETPDAQTVRIILDQPNGLLLERMAFEIWATDMTAAPRHYLKEFHQAYRDPADLQREAKAEGFNGWGERLRNRWSWRNPQCPRMGAWVMHTPPPATTVVMERNPYYWKVDPDGRQLPYLDRITFSLADAESIPLKLMRGDSAFQERYLRPKDYALLMAHQTHGGYRVRHYLGASVIGLMLNRGHRDPAMRALMNDGRFGQALSVAVDREELARLFTFGAGHPTQPVPAVTSPYYNAQLAKADTQFDPKLANQLLDEMGCTRGPEGWRMRPDGRPLRLQMETSAQDLVEVGQVVIQAWARAGVAVDIRLLARELYYANKDSANQDVIIDAIGGNETNPLLDPRAYVPGAAESSWSGLYGTWVRTDGVSGERPPEDIIAMADDWKAIEATTDPDVRKQRFADILARQAKVRACIGLYTTLPPFLVVRDDCLNAPMVAAAGWSFRGPGCIAPECLALDPAARRRK